MFYATIMHCKAKLGRGQPGLMRWILLWSSGAGSIARTVAWPAVLYATTVPLMPSLLIQVVYSQDCFIFILTGNFFSEWVGGYVIPREIYLSMWHCQTVAIKRILQNCIVIRVYIIVFLYEQNINDLLACDINEGIIKQWQQYVNEQCCYCHLSLSLSSTKTQPSLWLL